MPNELNVANAAPSAAPQKAGGGGAKPVDLLRALAARLANPDEKVTKRTMLADVERIIAALSARDHQALARPAELPPASTVATPAAPAPLAATSTRPTTRSRNSRSWTPSAQQMDAVDMCGTLDNEPGKIEARAGSGKTSTLEIIAESLPGRGVYIAYNRDIVKPARAAFPPSTQVTTSHALAFAAVGSKLRDSGRAIRNLRAADVIEALDLKGNEQQGARVFMIGETLRQFLNSVDETVTARSVPRDLITRIERQLSRAGVPPGEVAGQADEAAEGIWMAAQRMWETIADPSQTCPVPHDAYFKIWALQRPTLEADYVLLDEAQDTNPVMQMVFERQSARRILVGDRWQAIYQFRGATNAMSTMQGRSVALTQSWRFGPAIAEAANSILRQRGERDLLIGAATHESVVGAVDSRQPYTILARRNATICMKAAELCLHTPTAIVGGATEITELMAAALALYQGNREVAVRHPSLRSYPDYRSLQEHVEQTKDPEMRPIVAMLESHGAGLRRIIEALQTKTVAEDAAAVVLSTIHKSKGREWDQVVLADDYAEIRDGSGRIRDEEANLLYVAATRAKRVLTPNDKLVATQSGLPDAAIIKGGPHTLRAGQVSPKTTAETIAALGLAPNAALSASERGALASAALSLSRASGSAETGGDENSAD